MDEDKNVLDMDLSSEDEALLRESLENWKEEVMSGLMEEVEQAKEGKIEELEEQNIEFREEMKEEFATKMLDALKEMKEEIRAEVLSEVYESNPELQILEKIKELVAPTLNEEFLGNVFADELQTLREKNEELESERTLDEGAKKLAELIAPYGEKTQNIILALIKEGGPDEVTEQFYDLIESLEAQEEIEEDDDDDEDDDEDDEDDDDDDDEDEDEDEDDDEDEDEDEDDDDETDEDTDKEYDRYIKEDEEGAEEEEKKNGLTYREQIKRSLN